jgi:hypothetical protein
MTDHLADCDDYAFSGAGFHPNCERICICRQVRRIEKRVLDATREAVAALPWTSETWQAHGERAAVLAAIDALREKP